MRKRGRDDFREEEEKERVTKSFDYGGVLHAVWKHDVLALAVADDFVRELRSVALDRAVVRPQSIFKSGGGGCRDDDVLERRQLFVQI